MRRTRKNPNGSYRMTGKSAGAFRIEHQMEETVFYGDAINALGEYEDLGSIEELRQLKNTYGHKK